MDVWCVYVFVLSWVYVQALRRTDHSSKRSYHQYNDHETEKSEAMAQGGALEPVKKISVTSKHGRRITPLLLCVSCLYEWVVINHNVDQAVFEKTAVWGLGPYCAAAVFLKMQLMQIYSDNAVHK
jgi:hypothetical protein